MAWHAVARLDRDNSLATLLYRWERRAQSSAEHTSTPAQRTDKNKHHDRLGSTYHPATNDFIYECLLLSMLETYETITTDLMKE